MNLELIKRKQGLSGHDGGSIARLSEKLRLHPVLVEMLLSRGIDSEEAITGFLIPDKRSFHDPFLLKGMKEAAERIEYAIENDERVVVYGDYDADGICASAILSLYLCERGLNVYTHIPSRSNEGYGLNTESVERIIEQCCPDLIITCDCGISGYKEVALAQDLGVDVIVTDHHEIAERIPDCTVINPKLPGCGYPIDYFCGAGVALKVVHALGGADKAMQYLDLAAVATIADLVPLLDENRLIVQLGLREPSKMNKGLRALLLNQQIDKAVTSGDIAYKIAPRINAAGRMGDAYRAFELLTTSDMSKIETIITEINDDNAKRKALCDEMYDEAIELIRRENLTSERAVVLSHPTWEKGITGILAARIAGDFKRPAFILVNSGDVYKGTSRSIAGINIYELLSSLSDILTEFGGHSQAAGFSIPPENIPLFKERVNEYLKRFDKELFLPSCEYDAELRTEEIDLELARALDKIEPVGNSNPRPVFKVRAGRLEVAPCKSNYQHTNITAQNGLNILAFNFYNENQYLLGDSEKELAVEVQLNSFANKESVKTVLRAVKPSALYVNDNVAKAAFLKYLELDGKTAPRFSTYDEPDLCALFGESEFGTLVIAGCAATYARVSEIIGARAVLHEFMYSSTKNNYSKIAVSPVLDDSLMLSNYGRIIFADSPVSGGVISYLNGVTAAEIYVPSCDNGAEFFKGLDMSREAMSAYYEAIRRNVDINAVNAFSYFRILAGRVPDLQLNMFIAGLLVFTELGFVSNSGKGFSLKVNAGVKNPLTGSRLYNLMREKCGTAGD